MKLLPSILKCYLFTSQEQKSDRVTPSESDPRPDSDMDFLIETEVKEDVMYTTFLFECVFVNSL